MNRVIPVRGTHRSDTTFRKLRMLESLLAYAHYVAIFALIVFVTGEAALCRPEWLNAAVVRRLGRLYLLYLVAAILVVATGVARTVWGIKGSPWYWQQPLLHLKVTVFVVIGLISLKPTFTFIRWRRQLDADGTLPAADDILRTRRWIMVQAHLLLVLPLLASWLSRGVFTR